MYASIENWKRHGDNWTFPGSSQVIHWLDYKKKEKKEIHLSNVHSPVSKKIFKVKNFKLLGNSYEQRKEWKKKSPANKWSLASFGSSFSSFPYYYNPLLLCNYL